MIDEAHLLYHEATEAFSDRVDAQGVEQLLGDLRGRQRQRPLPQRLRAGGAQAPAGRGPGSWSRRGRLRARGREAPALSRALGEAIAGLARGAAPARTTTRVRGRRPADGRVHHHRVAHARPARPARARRLPLARRAAGGEPRQARRRGGGRRRVLPDDHREHAALAALSDDAAVAAELLGGLPEGGGSGDGRLGRARERDADRGSATGAPRWALTRSPVTPAGGIREILWDRLRSAVLTSATLTVAGSFAYFRDMTGLAGDVEAREQVFPSPFDYRRQAVLVLEHDPGGAWRPDELAARQGERLKQIAEVTGGRTLALFTNKRDMHRVAAAVGEHVEDDGVLVLAQGLHGSAASLAEEFRTHPETILLGVDTLWTGQDFPGDALTCLVIAKLPFPRLDPLFRARRQGLRRGRRALVRTFLPAGGRAQVPAGVRPADPHRERHRRDRRARPSADAEGLPARTSSPACPRWTSWRRRRPKWQRWWRTTCGASRRTRGAAEPGEPSYFSILPHPLASRGADALDQPRLGLLAAVRAGQVLVAVVGAVGVLADARGREEVDGRGHLERLAAVGADVAGRARDEADVHPQSGKDQDERGQEAPPRIDTRIANSTMPMKMASFQIVLNQSYSVAFDESRHASAFHSGPAATAPGDERADGARPGSPCRQRQPPTGPAR